MMFNYVYDLKLNAVINAPIAYNDDDKLLPLVLLNILLDTPEYDNLSDRLKDGEDILSECIDILNDYAVSGTSFCKKDGKYGFWVKDGYKIITLKIKFNNNMIHIEDIAVRTNPEYNNVDIDRALIRINRKYLEINHCDK